MQVGKDHQATLANLNVHPGRINKHRHKQYTIMHYQLLCISDLTKLYTHTLYLNKIKHPQTIRYNVFSTNVYIRHKWIVYTHNQKQTNKQTNTHTRKIFNLHWLQRKKSPTLLGPCQVGRDHHEILMLPHKHTKAYFADFFIDFFFNFYYNCCKYTEVNDIPLT